MRPVSLFLAASLLQALPLTQQFGTFLGGSTADLAQYVRADSQGNIVVAGLTGVGGIPVVNATPVGPARADRLFAAKFSPQGQLLWSNYYGGNNREFLHTLAVDSSGNIYLGGRTMSTDWPSPTDSGKSFLLALSPTGMVRYAKTFDEVDRIWAIAVAPNGTIYAAGQCITFRDPVNGFQPNYGGGEYDAFFFTLNQSGTVLTRSYYGGNGNDEIWDMSIEPGGNLSVVGVSSSTNLPASGFPALGGTINLAPNRMFYASIDLPAKQVIFIRNIPASTGRPYRVHAGKTGVWIAGFAGPNLAVTGNAWQSTKTNDEDHFLVRINYQGGNIGYATYAHPVQVGFGPGLTIDENDRAFMTGYLQGPPQSNPWRVSSDALQPQHGGATGDAYLLVVQPNGTVDHATFLGGPGLERGSDVASLGGGKFAWLGTAFADGLPVTSAAVQSQTRGLGDFWLGIYQLGTSPVTPPVSPPPVATPTLTANAVVNGASFQGGGVAPGEIVTLYPQNAGPDTLMGAQLTPQNTVATLIGETRVLFDGVAAPMLYTSKGQISAIVPYGVAGRATTSVEVEYKGAKSAAVSVPVAPTSPALFTTDGKQAVAANGNSCCNSPSSKAAAGGVLVLYATGEGEPAPIPIDGSVSNYATLADYPRPKLPVSVIVGGKPATIQYAGAAPGLVAGVMQLNIQLAPDTPSGDAVPIILQVGNATSPASVTVAVQ
jgi:uncharacterized protein (TIGR03437 family)